MTPLRLSSLALAAALAVSAQTGGTVQGRVTNALRGEPVANALVTMRELNTTGGTPPQVYICQTGADGRFSIAGVAPGVYDPRPSKQGFEARPSGRFATAHDFPPVTVEVGKVVTGLELHLTPDSVIAGKVLDGDGDPVRYVDVEAQQYQYVAGKKQLHTIGQAQTNDRGEYRIFYLAPGRYYVHAAANRAGMSFDAQNGRELHYRLAAEAYYPGVADAPRASELDALPGSELDGIDIRLIPEKTYAIRGKLSSREGGYPVRVVDRIPGNFRPPLYSMVFTRDGYEIRDIAPGSYLVIADFGNGPNREERLYARQPVDVIDSDVDGVDLTLLPGVQVAGTVKVEGSTPLDLEKMQLIFQMDDFSGQQLTKLAADGKFTSAQLAPGSYPVKLEGRNAYVKTVRLGDRVLPDRKIDTGQLSGDLTVVVSADFGQVEGTVTDEAGKPVYNANVTLIPDQSRPDWHELFQNVFTLTSGKFSFHDVQPGEYKVYAWLGSEPGAPQSADFRKPYEDRGVAVKVEANRRNAVDLKAIVPAPDR